MRGKPSRRGLVAIDLARSGMFSLMRHKLPPSGPVSTGPAIEKRVFLPCWRSCRNWCPSSLRCRCKAHSYTMDSATTINDAGATILAMTKDSSAERNIQEERSRATITTAAIKKLWQAETWRGWTNNSHKDWLLTTIETLLFHAVLNLASFCQSAPQYHTSACWDGTNIHALSRYPPWPRKRGQFFFDVAQHHRTCACRPCSLVALFRDAGEHLAIRARPPCNVQPAC